MEIILMSLNFFKTDKLQLVPIPVRNEKALINDLNTDVIKNEKYY
jgi:hypothetical protein